MSYVNMNHHEWVQRQITKAQPKKSLPMPSRAARMMRDGKGWLAAPETLSRFQQRAFDILGIVGGGIYNCPISWDSLEWEAGTGLGVPWGPSNGFGTWDFDNLTWLVFLCHEARIRCDISPNGPKGLKIYLHPRRDDGSISERHPNLDEAVVNFRSHVGPGHPIMFDVEIDAPGRLIYFDRPGPPTAPAPAEMEAA